MKHVVKLICLPLVMIITVAVAATGCDQIADTAQGLKGAVDNLGGETSDQPNGSSTTAEKGITLQEYFGGQTPNIYRMIDGSTVLCQTGDCPDELNLTPYLTNEDFFAGVSSEVLADKVIAYTGPMNNVSMVGSCTEKSSFSYPYEFKIIEQTAQRIVVTGTGNGHYEQVGDGCGDGQWTYSYETQETWIYTTEQLQKNSTVSVETDAPANLISATGWRNPQSNPQFSAYGITVVCQSPEGFRVRPFVKVVKVNGYPAEASLSARGAELGPGTSRFTFGAYYDAEYTVVGGCWTYGKNGAVLDTIYSDAEIVVKVTGSQQGALPESFYKK